MTVHTVNEAVRIENPRLWHNAPIPALGLPEAVPSINQEVLWLRWPETARDPAFTISTAIGLSGAVDPHVFQAACDSVVEHQPTLRTSFGRSADGSVVQRIGARTRASVHCEKLAPSLDVDQIARVTSEWARQPFELVGCEPARIALFQLGRRGAVVQVAMHHAFTDWVSIQLLLHELRSAYDALVAERPPVPEHPSVDYGDFAAWERDLLACGGWHDDIDHWSERFRSPPAPLWPKGADRRDRLDFSAGRLAFDVDCSVAATFGRFAREQRLTTFMATLAVYRLLLHWATERKDIVVGVPTSSRTRHEVEGLVGCFLNFVPMHGIVVPGMAITDLLSLVRVETISEMRHATVSTGAVYETAAPNVCPWRALPFQARLIVLSTHEGVGTASAALGVTDVQTEASPYDLTLGLWARGSSMFGRFDYRKAVFERGDVVRLVAALRQLLRIIPAATDWTVTDVIRAVDESVGSILDTGSLERRRTHERRGT